VIIISANTNTRTNFKFGIFIFVNINLFVSPKWNRRLLIIIDKLVFRKQEQIYPKYLTVSKLSQIIINKSHHKFLSVKYINFKLN
jgi:hypothetical protein